MTGPVSRALLGELTALVRQHGLVLWPDPPRTWASLASSLEQAGAEAPFPLLSYKGSWLELMFALHPWSGTVDPPALVVYLPGVEPKAALGTPLLEVWEAGRAFPERALHTIIERAAAGRVSPERIAAFLAGDPDLSAADAWLTGALDEGAGGGTSPLRTTPLSALLDELLAGRGVGWLDDRAALHEILAARLGLDAAWRRGLEEPKRPEELAFLLASFAMAVEYVHDLRRPPSAERLRPLVALSAPLVAAARELCAHLRERHAAFYQRSADEVQGWLPEEVKHATADDLGRIDTFRFEEEKLLGGAIDDIGIEQPRWATALERAAPRAEGGSFWTARAPERQAAWSLVRDAAHLGLALEAAARDPQRWMRVEDALDSYLATGAAVDRAHRDLEQRWALVWPGPLPAREALRARVEGLRGAWSSWANASNQRFAEVQAAAGPLPDPASRQRELFEQVVAPLLSESGCTALFLLDAFRYEMATALLEALDAERGGATLRLTARLAELPTTTAVGMNALAPVAEGGLLSPVIRDGEIKGFHSREFQIVSPEQRRRAMASRVGGALPWLELDELGARDGASLRATVGRGKLLVVVGDDVDAAGERGLGLEIFERALVRVRGAWRVLREAGVRRAVFTADHGFLLLDPRTPRQDCRVRGPDRRHALTPIAQDAPGELRLPLSALGYGGSELQLLCPTGLSLFDTRRPPPSFAHGGASLQERVIPVLTVSTRTAPGGDALRYALRAEAPPADAPRIVGASALELRLEVVDQAGLRFGGARPLEVTLAARHPGVSVELLGAAPGGAMQGGTLRVGLDGPVLVWFRLLGEVEGRAPVEALHPTGEAAVTPATAPGFYDVLRREPRAKTEPEAPRTAPPPEPSWLEALPAYARPLFQHLATHRVATEAEAVALLGGPRPARRLALEWESLTALLPFEVIVMMVGSQRQYERRGGEG